MNNVNEQFSGIYDQYIEKIYRFVYLKVNSPESAEDITSKVFLRAFEAYKKQPKIENMAAFLYQIARNSVIDHYRQRARATTISTDSIAQVADLSVNLHEKAVLKADVEIVKTAILKLKKDYQDIILWHYLEDMPVSQIAKMTAKPEGTIRVMLHRGLKDLKDVINS